MAAVPPTDLNHFICTLGEAEIKNLTPSIDQYDTINDFLDYQAEHNGDQLAIAVPKSVPDRGGPRKGSTAGLPSDKGAVFSDWKEPSTSSGTERWTFHFFNFTKLRDCSLQLARTIQLPETTKAAVSKGTTGIGSKHSRCVGLMGRSDLGFLFMWLALMRLGVSVMIITPSSSEENVEHLCRQCNINIVFYDSTVREEYYEASDYMISCNPPYKMRAYSTSNLMDLFSVLDSTPRNQGISLHKATGESTAYHHHTSGTSGLLKPVPYSHHAACGALPILNDRNTLTFTTTPLYTGGIADCLRAWTSLSTICLAPNDGCPLTSETIIESFSQAQKTYEFLMRRFCGSPKTGPELMYFSCVPMIAQMLSKSAKGLAFLRTMKIVGVGGASMPKEDGDFLVSEGINLASRFGSAECSFLLSSHRHYETDREWQYFRVPEGLRYLEFEPLPDGSGRFELVVTKGWPHLPKCNRPNGSFATSDLFEPHPFIKNAWKHVGRKDTQITLSTGKKFDPVCIEEAFKRFPLVQDAFIFGNGQMYPGAIILKSRGALGMSNEEVRDTIWPYIESLNNIGPTHAKIFKDMLVIKPHTALLAKTAKGTTRRQMAEIYYDADIKDSYKGVTAKHGSEVSLDIVMDIVKTAIGATIELHYDSDFRAHDIDSVQATRIRSHLNSAFSSASDAKPFPWNLVYECGSVRALTDYIKASRNGPILDDDENEVQRMNSIVKQFGKSLMDETTKACFTLTQDFKETILITGVTGRLGVNIVSLLRSILSNDKKLRIVCLVRAKNDKEALGRVEEALRYHDIYQNLVSTTTSFECRAAKLDEIEFGLSRDILFDLRKHVTTIIHAAWEVNFSIPLRDFSEQFQGLRNLINFSLSGERPKHMVFCSSIASVAKASNNGNLVIETIDRDPLHAGSLGYAKSKWVAEAICSLACQKTRANISIVRIGQLCGNTVNGIWNEKEAWPLMLSAGVPGCLNSLPELPMRLSWLPLDIAAAAIVEIALQKALPYPLLPLTALHKAKVFHLVNNSNLTWTNLLKWIGQEKTEEFSEWLLHAELPSPEGLPDDHPARSLLGFWKAMEREIKEDSTVKQAPQFGLLRTRQVSSTMKSFVDLDEKSVKKMWKWIQTVAKSREDEKNDWLKTPASLNSPLISDDDEGVSGILEKH
ncbi:cfa1e60f-4cd0-4bb5-a63d-777f45a35f64 [Sclerotinia trifoliorum]|uniref:Cfa1e60f-4cd0-4bb5-a63d-777f45a35f64 n=1 Tax=Sclerotinia trifoliorum TaxID=28548 RepID=A0A8H2W2M7_9HELO|nr:cfa1e60f-4cd0-4bb5-a63d-777f45a35f64 [Sclerotinia trifoliorum]